KVDFGGGNPYGIGCCLAGLERVVVKHRLEFDEGPLVGRRQRLVAGELTPGEVCTALVEDVLHRLSNHVEGTRSAVELDLAALHSGKSRFQGAGQSADRRIAC